MSSRLSSSTWSGPRRRPVRAARARVVPDPADIAVFPLRPRLSGPVCACGRAQLRAGAGGPLVRGRPRGPRSPVPGDGEGRRARAPRRDALHDGRLAARSPGRRPAGAAGRHGRGARGAPRDRPRRLRPVVPGARHRRAPHSTRTGRLGARRHVVHWRGYYEWVGAGGGSLSRTRVRPHRGEGPGVEEPAALAGATPASHRVLPRFEPAASSTGRWQAWRPRVDSVFASCTVLRRHRRMLGWTACPTSPAAASPDAYDGRGGANGRHGLIQLYAALRHGIVMARGHAGCELRGDDVARRSRRRVHAPLLLEAMLDGSWRPSAER